MTEKNGKREDKTSSCNKEAMIFKHPLFSNAYSTLYFLSISITSITLFALFFSLKVSKDFGCPPIFFIRKKEVTMTHNTCSSILSPTSENVERDTSNVEYKSEASLLFVSYFHILTYFLILK